MWSVSSLLTFFGHDARGFLFPAFPLFSSRPCAVKWIRLLDVILVFFYILLCPQQYFNASDTNSMTSSCLLGSVCWCKAGFHNHLILTLMKVNLTSGLRSNTFFHCSGLSYVFSISNRAPDKGKPHCCLVITYPRQWRSCKLNDEYRTGTEGNKLPYE